MQKGCLSVDVEAQNMFSNLIPEDTHRVYQRSHTRKDAIILDMLVHNYLPDVNANGKCSMPAIFDIKTLRVDKFRQRTIQGALHTGGFTLPIHSLINHSMLKL
jgi:hypothetical protein